MKRTVMIFIYSQPPHEIKTSFYLTSVDQRKLLEGRK